MTGHKGTAATATWTSGRSAYLVGADSGATHAIRLGATDASDTNIVNLAINVNATATGASSGAAGNVPIGNSGEAGILTLVGTGNVVTISSCALLGALGRLQAR